jgi:hypothetical protein
MSVAGREFSYDLIKKLTGLAEQELLSRLSVLKDSELLYERGRYFFRKRRPAPLSSFPQRLL